MSLAADRLGCAPRVCSGCRVGAGPGEPAGPSRHDPRCAPRFARSLGSTDEVVLEATCNTYAIARLLQQYAGRVVVSNPLRTRAIAEAKIKN